ncbi:hypothetical protein [Agromyces laixinhei]|uniref:hypothetical protein n=1 Tax=Agromyces laixinhei TaxID=2585717 RepID=UPI0012ED363A|nr:hypothetical protein [Agromyces laixinhei]
MKFPELCTKLVGEIGSAKVSCNLYPGIGATSSEQAEMGLWVHDGIFDVGGEERGEWNSTRQFSTEDEACEYIYERLTREPDIWVQTPEERRRSQEVSDAYFKQLKERFRKRDI